MAGTKYANNCNTISESLLKSLTRAYPKAMSFGDMFKVALNGVPASQHPDKLGGRYLSDLVKKGLVKKVTTGYYMAIPQAKSEN